MKNIWKIKPIKIRFGFDTDRDGVKDRFDCRPFNPFKQHNDAETLCNQMGGLVRDSKCVIRNKHVDSIGMDCEEPPLIGKKITRYMTSDEALSFDIKQKQGTRGANYVLCEFPVGNVLNVESDNRERGIRLAKRRITERERKRKWWRTATEEQKEKLHTEAKKYSDLKPEKYRQVRLKSRHNLLDSISPERRKEYNLNPQQYKEYRDRTLITQQKNRSLMSQQQLEDRARKERERYYQKLYDMSEEKYHSVKKEEKRDLIELVKELENDERFRTAVEKIQEFYNITGLSPRTYYKLRAEGNGGFDIE